MERNKNNYRSPCPCSGNISLKRAVYLSEDIRTVTNVIILCKKEKIAVRKNDDTVRSVL